MEAKTSYNLFLGRPWVHENGVVPSTLHQCMKYMKDGEVMKINANINPFTEKDSYFADAKIYLDSGKNYMEEHVEAGPIDLEDSKVQLASINMSKKRTEEVSIQLEPLRISSMKGKVITSSEYTSIEKTEESRKGKTPRWTSLFERIGRLIPRVSAFERLGCKDEREFPNNEVEDSNLTQSSYYITVEKDQDVDNTNDDIHEAPPQLKDCVQLTIHDLKELNLGTLEDPRPIFVCAYLTPEEEMKYFRLLVEFKDVFSWSYKEISGPSPRIVINHLGIKREHVL
ncbi:hypothetical protein EJD97_002722 [Solanum chilense]|uniref:Uncharacterized protein n=1 Tax=Solanum chilense TaxID=4083 RepID=A0A6N2CDX1_SOLCI|nr:hypothetical protein EJD97_002722 [Solanum chilense]